MKRILSFMVCAVMLCGCSATKKTDTPGTDRLFSCNAVITCEDMEIVSTVKRLGGGMWNAEISSPAELAGISLEYSSEEITASYQGLSFSLDKINAPKANILGTVFNTIDGSALLTEMPYSETEESRIFVGECELGKYEITTDIDSNLTGFSLPDSEITAEFSEFCVIT